MIMCVLLCYPVSIRIYYQQGGLFLVMNKFSLFYFQSSSNDKMDNVFEVFNLLSVHCKTVIPKQFNFFLMINTTEDIEGKWSQKYKYSTRVM